MNLANQVAGVSSEDVRNTLMKQIDKVSQNPTSRNVGQLNATVQAANNQANTSTNPSDVAKRLSSKGVSSEKGGQGEGGQGDGSLVPLFLDNR